MKKKLITMFFAVCFMVWFLPVNAFAMNTTVSWKNEVKNLINCSGGSIAGKCQLQNNTLTIFGGYHLNIEEDETLSEDIIIYGNVNNYGTISNGQFNEGKEVINYGTINSGTFKGTVTNEGRITKGTFNIIVNKITGIVYPAPDVTYNQLINEGNTSNPGDDEGNTPPQNPGNNENNTLNSKDDTNNDSENIFVEPVVIVVPEGQKYVENVLEQLSAVPTDGKVVIDTEDWYCFNKTLAEKIANRKDVAVTIKYKYQGKRYEVTIPAGSDVVSLLDENGFVGFRYLDVVFGGREITE